MESINRTPVQKSLIGIKHCFRNGVQITVKSLELGSWVDEPSKLRVHIYNGGNRVASVNPNIVYLIDRNGFAHAPVEQDLARGHLYPRGSVERLLSFETSYLEIDRLAIVEEKLGAASTISMDMSHIIDNIIKGRKRSSDGLMPWEPDGI